MIPNKIGAVLGAHMIKKGGCTSNLLVSLLASERAGRRTVTILPKDVKSFRNFHEFADSPFVEIVRVYEQEIVDGFCVLVNKKQKPLVTSYGAHKKVTCARLTILGRYMAFAQMWDLSLHAMCLASEINLHNCTASSKNTTICQGSCKCHAVQRMGLRDRQTLISMPFTMVKFARRFPHSSRCKMLRALRELESKGVISVSKSLHCNVVRANLEHPLFSRCSMILSHMTSALHDLDTLENASRAIKYVDMSPRDTT